MNKLANEHVSGTINANENSSKSSQVLINDIISLSLFLASGTTVEQVNATDFDTGINAKIR